jgi:hypothetical protein
MERVPEVSNWHHTFFVPPFSDIRAQPEREGAEGERMWWGGVSEGLRRTDLRAWAQPSVSPGDPPDRWKVCSDVISLKMTSLMMASLHQELRLMTLRGRPREASLLR